MNFLPLMFKYLWFGEQTSSESDIQPVFVVLSAFVLTQHLYFVQKQGDCLVSRDELSEAKLAKLISAHTFIKKPLKTVDYEN